MKSTWTQFAMLTSAIVGALFWVSTSHGDIVLISEDFDSLPDQSARPLTDFGSNIPIGYTTVAPAEAGAEVWYRNGMRGFGATPNASFTGASGTVAQLRSFSGGGFSLISVPLGDGTPGSGTGFNPIPVSVLDGDIIRLSFDFFVETVPTSPSLGFFWNSNSLDGNQNTTWDEYLTANVGDVINFSKDLLITAATADTTEIGPQFQLSTNGGSTFPFSTNYGQLDNFVLEIIQIPEPSTMTLALIGLVGLVARRRFR